MKLDPKEDGTVAVLLASKDRTVLRKAVALTKLIWQHETVEAIAGSASAVALETAAILTHYAPAETSPPDADTDSQTAVAGPDPAG